MANGPEERQPEAEGGADQGVDVLGRRRTVLLHQLGGLVKQGVLQAVQHESGDVLDDGGLFAGRMDEFADLRRRAAGCRRAG